jgi:hypothetical protein
MNILKKHRSVAGYSAVAGCTALALAGVVFFRAPDSVAYAQVTEPVLSSIAVTPAMTSALVTWNTDLNSTSQIAYGTTASYGSLSPMSSTSVMNHAVALTGLAAGTTYHYKVISGNGTSTPNKSADYMFMTGMATTTSSTTDIVDASSTDPVVLQTEIQELEAQLALLTQQIIAFLNAHPDHHGNIGDGGWIGTTTPSMSSSAMIDQSVRTIRAGTTVDFTGRNFGHEEGVSVTMNGHTVTTAHADGGGNFSTGSLPALLTNGTVTYTFTGQNSGDVAQATVTTN